MSALDPAFQHAPPWNNTLPSGTPWYEVTARNSHDITAPPSVLMATSYQGTVYAENDDN